MDLYKKFILGLGGFFLLIRVFGAVGALGTSGQSTAVSHESQVTISPVSDPTVSISHITVIPTATPTIAPWPTSTPTPTPYVAPIQPTTPPATIQSSGLSNDNHYTNVDGNQVHSPAYSNSVPAGATAVCGDGTYSFSLHHSGTCSHHGGVAEWL